MDEDGIGLNTRAQREYRQMQWELTVNALADFCQSQNAQFDRARFLQACGVTTAPSTEVKCKKCGSPLSQQRYCWNEECEYYHKPQKVARTA